MPPRPISRSTRYPSTVCPTSIISLREAESTRYSRVRRPLSSASQGWGVHPLGGLTRQPGRLILGASMKTGWRGRIVGAAATLAIAGAAGAEAPVAQAGAGDDAV